jgi:hypothetical protein
VILAGSSGGPIVSPGPVRKINRMTGLPQRRQQITRKITRQILADAAHHQYLGQNRYRPPTAADGNASRDTHNTTVIARTHQLSHGPTRSSGGTIIGGLEATLLTTVSVNRLDVIEGHPLRCNWIAVGVFSTGRTSISSQGNRPGSDISRRIAK